MDIYGNPTPSLQGSVSPLQGSQPTLQGGYNPQQATGIYGPPAPTIAAPSAPAAPAAPKAPVAPAAPRPTVSSIQVAQPDAQINSIFSPYIGSRPSASNPGTLEYYNKQTGQGFANPQALYSFASTLGAGIVNSFNQLHASVNSGTVGPQVQDIQSANLGNPNQSIASGAGSAGLSVDDYLKLIQSGTALTPDQITAIQSQLGIPEAASSAFAQPAQGSVDFYNQLYGSAGLADVKQRILDLNSQVAQRQQNFLDAQGTINENPFLSEASRVGRVSRLNDKAQAEINNLLQQQQQYQTLYQNGLGEINNVVQAHTQDFQTNQQLNAAKLTYLQGLAEKQATATQAAATQKASYQYLPAYLQAKAKATAPATVTAPSGAVFSYDKTTGTYQQIVGPGGNYDVNPLTGDLFSKNTGQGLGSIGGSYAINNSPTGLTTPAAINNNPGNLRKPDGSWQKFATPEAGFQALQQDIQYKISGQSTHKIPDGPNAGTKLGPNSTLTDMMRVYAPTADHNDPVGYAATIAKQLGISPNTPISQLSGQLPQIAAAIAQHEDGKYAAAIGLTGSSQGGNLIQTLAQQLLEGSTAPSQVKDRKEYGAAVALANQMSLQKFGKPFDTQAADINYQNAQDIRPILNNEQSANAHLDTVMQDAKNLGLTGNRLANIAILDAKLAVGDSSAKNYVQAVNDAQSEIAKVLAGNGAVTDSVRTQAEGFLDKYVGPSTLQGLIDQARTLMHQKVVAYTAQRNTSGGLQMPSGYSSSSNTDLSDLNFAF